ncbi:MAG: S8 family serine peptidase [Acidilobaceae archaeon]|nr:S8 family serine peptidase [Acidilobaceae archaeon]
MRQQSLFLVLLILLPLPGALVGGASHDSEELYIVFAPLFSKEGLGPLKSSAELFGGEVMDEFPTLGAALVKGPRELARALRQLGYIVSPNLQLQLISPLSSEEVSLRYSVPSIGAPGAWALGLNGSGVRVAVIDTGIENSHPWLMRGNRSVVVWEVDATESGEVDYCGKGTRHASIHGTHVAGIIASQSPDRRGVAPGALLYDIIAFSKRSDCISTDESTLLRALEHALRGPDGRPNSGDEADVINLSVGALFSPELIYPAVRGFLSRPAIVEALERAAAMNKVIVVAAGNWYGINLYNLLCLAAGVICVGAADDGRSAGAGDDSLAPFTSRGPGFPGIMVPHLVAPGVLVESSVPTETGRLSYPLSGTSMAAPHVAGAAAIIVQQAKREGAVSPHEVLRALAQTARDVKGYKYTFWGQRAVIPIEATTVSDQGAGLLNVSAAVRREVIIDLGGRPFAHLLASRSGKLELRVVSLSDRPLEFTLSVVAKEEHSLREVSGFSLNVSRLLLPPRSSASVELTFKDLPVGTYGGYVMLRGDSATYRFPFLLTVPVELPPEGGLLAQSINLRVISRSLRDVPMLYVNVKSPFPDPLFLSAAVRSELYYSVAPEIAVISPFGTVSSSYDYNHFYLFLEPELYLLIPRVYSLVASPVELRLLMGAVSPAEGVRRALEAVSSLSARLEALELEVRNLQASVTNLHASLVNLEAALRALKAEARRLNQSIEALQRSVGELERSLRALRQELQQESEARKADVARLEQSIRALGQSLSALEESLKALRRELQREVEERKAEVARLEQLLKQESATLERLVQQESDLRRADAARLNQSIGLLERALRAVEEAVRALRGDLQREAEARRAEDARLERLIVNESEARRAEIARLEGALRGLQQVVASLEGSLRALRVSLDSLEKRAALVNESLRAAIRAEAERISRLEAEARALRAGLEEASRDLGERLSALNKELERRSAELSQLARSHEDLSIKMEAEVHRLREELDLYKLVAIGSLLLALLSIGIAFRRRQ